jgi:hypothetical protein
MFPGNKKPAARAGSLYVDGGGLGRCFDAPLASLRVTARMPTAAGDCEGASEVAAHFRTGESQRLPPPWNPARLPDGRPKGVKA